MKTHIMKLNPAPFDMISSGIKTIELRLFDEKRREIEAGDTITFVNTEDAEKKISARVKALHRFESFTELYENLPLLECGYTEADVDTASPDDMDAYYSKEKQQLYGVVGIEIEVIGK